MGRRTQSSVVMAAATIALGMAGCDPGPTSGPQGSDAEASPNASIPARRLSGLDAGASDASTDSPGLLFGPNAKYSLPDAAPPTPTPLDPNEALRPEELTVRELGGVSLEGQWTWRDLPTPAEGPQVDADAIREAGQAAGFRCSIALAATGRMRMELRDVAMPMPRGAAILARADRYGVVVLWPNGTHYRVAAAGSIRATLGERRVDVTPLAKSSPKELGAGNRLGHTTRRLELSSPVGKVRLETTKLAEAGAGGPLLCRLFADLVGVHPESQACGDGEVVLGAQIDWEDGGGIGFEITKADKRTDLPATDLLVPPPGAAYLPSGLPAHPDGVFFAKADLERFRKAAVVAARPADRSAPGDGLLARNQSDRLLYLLLDGVPVVAVAPWSERYLVGPRAGRYRLQWRTFLGDFIDTPFESDLPARVVFGAIDAGTSPDGG
jgi:hypothetical protein